jgi:hypothetical protein
MNLKSILTMIFIMSTLFSSAQVIPNLGEEWKGEILKNAAQFTPGGMMKAGKLLLKNGQEFSIGINENNKIVFVETKSSSFLIKGIGVGKKLNEFTTIDSVKLHKSWGGRYVKIDKDWYAAFSLEDFTDSSKVLFVFKYDMPTRGVKAVPTYGDPKKQ